MSIERRTFFNSLSTSRKYQDSVFAMALTAICTVGDTGITAGMILPLLKYALLRTAGSDIHYFQSAP